MKPLFLYAGAFRLSLVSVLLCLAFSPVFAARAQEEDGSEARAQLEVRLGAMEDEMRAMRGKIEELEFRNQKLGEVVEKFQKDAEFRFNELSALGVPAASPDVPALAAGSKSAPEAQSKPLPPLNEISVKEPGKPAPTPSPAAEPADDKHTQADKPAKPPAEKTEEKAAPKSADASGKEEKAAKEAQEFPTARDHYNHAFRLLNQTKYEEAASSFRSFLKKYPKDVLAGNANYWLGETFYIRHDYVSAADSFRQGYEATPAGPKAPDNLLKLAMSLGALGHEKEACSVLAQVVEKFKGSANVARKAENEQKRFRCQ